jgi:thiol:disulfide interchange protein DsbC
MKKSILILLFMFTAVAATSIPSGATTLDIGKSITIGNGPKTVLEFTDPDCPFCRKASKYFEGRTDVTRHIFFYPLPRHPRAKEKARFILSMPDKAKAYHEVMSGKMDAAPPLAATKEGTMLQEEQQDIAKKSKVTSTPTFMINGRIIEGFDQKKIEEALGK